VKHAPKRLIYLLGTSLALWHLPVALHAADATGWDCTKSATGSWECGAGVIPTKPNATPELLRLPDGPITPPAAQTKPEPVPKPVEPVIAKPEPAPKPVEPVIAKPEPTPKPIEPVVAKPEPAPKPVEPIVAKPEPTPKPIEPVVAKPEPAPKPVEPVVAKPEPTPKPVEPIVAKIAANKTQQISNDDDTWALCPPITRPAIKKVSNAERANTSITLSADNADLVKDGISTFKGNVVVARADQRLVGDEIVYNRQTEIASAKGNALLEDSSIAMRGDEIQLNFKDNKTTVSNADFDLYERHGRGEAKTLHRDGNKNVTRLKNTTYTTCPTGNDDWYLNADKITLKHDEGFGIARNVSVNFKGIPFFYAPVISFPIDDRRKSGVLSPTFGSTSESGTEFSIPYYWNIAPNRDATITPRILSSRGLQLRGEYRYLNKKGNGSISGEYLASDNKYNGKDRYLFAYKNKAAITPRFAINTNFNGVSDNDYFEDLGNNISLSSITHLERRVDARYSGDFWNITGRLQGYQTIDRTIPNSSRPYERLPQVLVNAYLPDQHYGLDYGLKAEAVYFNRRNSVTGSRFDIQPSVSLPLRNSYGYITPKIGLRYTKYNLNNTLANSNSSPDRSLPIFSIDSGLHFERNTSFGGRAMTQTLEPRLYYLNIPKRNQNNLILDRNGQSVVFDSGLFDFSFDQLFRENRFSGADRIGDANQLTTALTTRFIDKNSGIERASASIGQIFYFQDRVVTLPNSIITLPNNTIIPGNIAAKDNTSSIVAEVTARFTRNLSARAGIQLNTSRNETEKGVASIRYQSDKNHILNLAYRQRQNLLEQTDFSVNWPINRQWSTVGRWNYALDQERTIDAFAGVEYEDCCWIFRVIGRRYVNDLNQKDENFALMFQLELKGLTSFGDRVKKFLGRGILGYDRDQSSDGNNF